MDFEFVSPLDKKKHKWTNTTYLLGDTTVIVLRECESHKVVSSGATVTHLPDAYDVKIGRRTAIKRAISATVDQMILDYSKTFMEWQNVFAVTSATRLRFELNRLIYSAYRKAVYEANKKEEK
jgi:hypothetical protein